MKLGSARNWIIVSSMVASPHLVFAQPCFELVRIGLTDAEHTNPQTGYRYGFFQTYWPPGVPTGMSLQHGLLSNWGQSTWAVDPADGSTIRIGFFDQEHTSAPTGRRESAVYFSFLATAPIVQDLVFGTSARYSGSTDVGVSTWKFRLSDRRMERIGLADAAHTNSATGERASVFVNYNGRGDVIGTSRRFSGAAYMGQSAWLVRGEGFETTRIGLTDAIHTSSGTGAQVSTPKLINAAGRVAGVSSLYHSLLFPPGQSAWTLDPSHGGVLRIGLLGAEHVDPSGYHSSDVISINDAGVICGTTERIVGGEFKGPSVWRFDPASGVTVELGMMDAEHTSPSGARTSRLSVLRPDGTVFGVTNRYNGWTWTGETAWHYQASSAATTRVGLSDAAHTRSNGWRSSRLIEQLPDGRLIGESTRSDGIANSIWMFAPASGTYTMLGLGAGFGDHRFVQLSAQNLVLGYSRPTPSGAQTTWAFNPANGQTTVLGLYDAEHSNSEAPWGNEFVFQVPDPPERFAIGEAQRRSDLGGGRTPWVADLQTGLTHRIGLTDAVHTSASGKRTSRMNSFVGGNRLMGWSDRFSGNETRGQTMYVVELPTFVLTPLVFSVRADGYAWSDAFGINGSDTLTGAFLDFSTSFEGVRRGYFWNPSGMSLLDDLVAGGFERAGYTLEQGIAMAGPFSETRVLRALSVEQPGNVTYALIPRRFCDADFDGNGDTGTDADIEAFFACLGGNCCATCGAADFNGDGDTGTDLDMEAFFRVLGGGNC